MIIRYYFDPTKNEFLSSYEGNKGVNSFSRFLNMGLAENKIQPGIRSIIDLRKANIIFKPSELGNITDLFIKNLQKIQSGRWALIIKTPLQAGIATYIQNSVSQLAVEIKVFSTMQAGKAWLNIE